MVQFDSPVVEALVERARTPLDTGALNEEVARALESMSLTQRDRGHLLLAQLVMLQGQLSAKDAAAQADEIVGLLRRSGDADSLVSALAVAAAILAATGDKAGCLDRCLDMTSIIRSHPDQEVSHRASSNFGAALIVLGAYNLSAPLFVSAIQPSLEDENQIGVVACSANLAMAVSRQALVTGKTIVEDAAHLEYLEIVESALLRIHGADEEMSSFVNAILAHSAQLRGDMEASARYWGDLDALTAHSSQSFVQYLCLIEAPLAFERGDIERAHVLIGRTLDHLSTPHIVPLGRVDALKLRSAIHEKTGNLDAALADARAASDLALRETSGLADLLIAQVDKRAALEEGQRALLNRATFLSEQALVDELSQVGNRRAYEAKLEALTSGAPHELAVLLCDIDGFKQVNDRFGHTFGDSVVERAGQIVTDACGGSENVFRYGGDEFVLFPGELPIHQAMELAENIRQTFDDEPWTMDGEPVHITCSIGVWTGTSAAIEHGVAEADRQMYKAKLAGRNTARAAATPARTSV